MESLLKQIQKKLNKFDQKIVSAISSQKDETQIIETFITDRLLIFTIKSKAKNDQKNN